MFVLGLRGKDPNTNQMSMSSHQVNSRSVLRRRRISWTGDQGHAKVDCAELLLWAPNLGVATKPSDSRCATCGSFQKSRALLYYRSQMVDFNLQKQPCKKRARAEDP